MEYTLSTAILGGGGGGGGGGMCRHHKSKLCAIAQ